jgi:UPF0755 protein
VAFLAISAWHMYVPLGSEPLLLKVTAGDNAASIAKKLKDNGIIRSTFLFRLLAKIRGTDRRLMAGTYELEGNYSLSKTLSLFETGRFAYVTITFPEGLTLTKTLDLIAEKELATHDELHAASKDTALVRELTGFRVSSLEGFLYPETYKFDVNLNARKILEIMTSQFFSELHKAGIDPRQTQDFYSRLILASIVEKESAHPDEREIIAGVMQNRINIGMRLESCSTVDYILEKQGVKRKVLTHADIAIDSPYNTYVYYGLPPGPICNPSLPSIQAALNPADTNYLYFVADRQGRNDFSETSREHFNKIQTYRRSAWE